jgi:hypothetical protein
MCVYIWVPCDAHSTMRQAYICLMLVYLYRTSLYTYCVPIYATTHSTTLCVEHILHTHIQYLSYPMFCIHIAHNLWQHYVSPVSNLYTYSLSVLLLYTFYACYTTMCEPWRWQAISLHLTIFCRLYCMYFIPSYVRTILYMILCTHYTSSFAYKL